VGLYLQVGVALAAIAVSVFSLITYLWLGLTVLLNGNRRSRVTWISGVGLLLAALFFLCHGALVGAGMPSGPSPTDFWWRLAWVPAFAAPLFWAATGLHYADLFSPWRRLRLLALQIVAVFGAVAALLAFLSWPAVAHYGDFIRLLDASLRLRNAAPPPAAASPALPLLGIAFVIYVTSCALLPWVSLSAARRLAALAGGRPLPSASRRGGGTSEAALLWDARDAWARSRPALLLASVLMMATGLVVALIGVMTSLSAHRAFPPLLQFPVRLPTTRPGHVPLLLVATDLLVQVALAGVGVAIGTAVVRQGILVERRLPQRGFLSHWRGMAIIAAVVAAVIAGMAGIQPEALPELLVLLALVSAAYAVFTWQSYVAHDRMLTQLRPFVASLATGHTAWLATDAGQVERSVEALFTSLCRDVLGAARGRLSLTAGRLHRTFVYTAPEAESIGQADAREWALPVSDERGVVARLVLGPRADGAGYTSADLEVARACGQRILDAVSEFAAAQAIASLARQRGLEAELSAALPRRVLHDEVLPRVHLAMLRLEALRAHLPIGAGKDGTKDGTPVSVNGNAGTAESVQTELGQIVRELGAVHRDLARLMRAAPIVNQRRMEHGLVSALRAALDGEFRGAFDELDWHAPDDARVAADALPPIVADLLLGAALEAVRNAGRHARGGDLHRHLVLGVVLAADPEAVSVTVSDSGVGLQTDRTDMPSPGAAPPVSGPSDTPVQPPAGPGTQSGLLTHGALIALIGGTLSVQSRPEEGATVVIRVPRSRDEQARVHTPANPAASAS
jgi:hypothetical protein